jgi:hypothetical protein
LISLCAECPFSILKFIDFLLLSNRVYNCQICGPVLPSIVPGVGSSGICISSLGQRSSMGEVRWSYERRRQRFLASAISTAVFGSVKVAIACYAVGGLVRLFTLPGLDSDKNYEQGLRVRLCSIEFPQSHTLPTSSKTRTTNSHCTYFLNTGDNYGRDFFRVPVYSDIRLRKISNWARLPLAGSRKLFTLIPSLRGLTMSYTPKTIYNFLPTNEAKLYHLRKISISLNPAL